MTGQAIERPGRVSDEDVFDYVAAFSAEVELLLLGRDAEVLRFLLQMVSLDARRRGAAAAARRSRGVPSREAATD